MSTREYDDGVLPALREQARLLAAEVTGPLRRIQISRGDAAVEVEWHGANAADGPTRSGAGSPNAASLNAAPVDVASLNTAFPNSAAPSGALPSGAAPSGALPNGAVPNGVVPSGAAAAGAPPVAASSNGVLPGATQPGAASWGPTPPGAASWNATSPGAASANGPGLVAGGGAEPAGGAGRYSVVSPMVGTFYRAAEPGATPFVAVGDLVEPNRVIGIVEAMKLMNEITAGQAGRVLDVLVGDGQPVEFGQALIALAPA